MADKTTHPEPSTLARRYDHAAGWWGDKMRSLGYYDAYLGFLSGHVPRADAGAHVLDIGCGSGAFAEAWAAIHGPAARIALLDPSGAMLTRAAAALARRGIPASCHQMTLGAASLPDPADHLLAAHVLEHCPDPGAALAKMRALTHPGGRLWLVASRPHWCNAIIWLKWRHRAFAPSEIHGLLAQSGWRLEAEYPFPSGPPSRTSRGYLAQAV